MEVQTSRSRGSTSRKQPRLGTSWPSAVAMSMLKMPPGLGHVPLLEMLRCGQRFPDELRGRVDEPFDGEIEFRIERQWLAHESDAFSLRCLTYWSNSSSRASHNRRRAVSQSSTTLNRSGAIS